MRIAFRVDASPQIGIGHVKRCLALADAWRACGLGSIRFVTRALDATGAKLIGKAGHDVAVLPAPVPGSQLADPAIPHAAWAGVEAPLDAEQTIASLYALRPDVVVVDHYAFDARWHEAVRRATGARLVAIDDLADRELAVDLLVDHNPAVDHRAKYGARLPAQAGLLGGPRFALIDLVYATAAKVSPHHTVASIGVFMGGADTAQVTLRVIEACRVHAGFAGSIEVVSTSANPRLDALRATCGRWPGTRLALDLPDLTAFFARHDLQIGAGGGASWERCCLGAPTLALVCADNQIEVVAELVRRGAVATSPSLSTDAIGRIVAALVSDGAVRRRLHEVSISLVDGRGAERVALALAAPELALREATQGDAEAVFAWRNDERTRAHFFDRSALTFESHIEWWSAALRNPRRKLLLSHSGARDVGVVRFDMSEGEALISVYLDPALTGQGLGTTTLRAAIAWMARAKSCVSFVRAEIRPENHASRAAFTAAGFVRVGPLEWHCTIHQ